MTDRIVKWLINFGRKAIVVLILLFCLGSNRSNVKADFVNPDEHGWFWELHQPPHELRVINGYPYRVPGVGRFFWAGVNSESLYAFTGNPSDYISIYPDGLYQSDDNGDTWQHLGDISTADEYYNVIVANPISPTILLAGTGPGWYVGGIYRSDNAGESWTNVLPGRMIYDIEFDPGNSRRAFASACCTESGGGGIFRSDDAGKTWQSISDQWLEDFTVHPISSTILIGAGGTAIGVDAGIYRSDDAGETWKKISSRSAPKLLVDNTNTSRMFSYGKDYEGIWRTEDGGQNWNDVSQGLPDPVSSPFRTILSAAIDYATNSLWVGLKYGGMFVSHDNGDNWYEANNGIPFYGGSINGPQCISIAISMTGKIAVACSSGGYIGIKLEELFMPILIKQ